MVHKKSTYIGRVFGIPIDVDYSWYFIFILLTWLLSAQYFPVHYPNWTNLTYWILGSLTSLFLFVSVLLHELGHSAAAKFFKIPVTKITLMIFGGIAQIARNPKKAGQEFWIAISGPVVNLILWAVFHSLASLFSSVSGIYAFCTYLAYINIVLAVFNLVPGFPLDGGKVLLALIWGFNHNLKKATIIAANIGRIFAFLFILWGALSITIGDIYDGLWLIFIGWFLDSAAAVEIHKTYQTHSNEAI